MFELKSELMFIEHEADSTVEYLELGDRSRFINRELSWLEFNERVLEEARDVENPTLERLSFLSITASNLDEFFMVRVASLRDLENAGYKKKDPAGLDVSDQLAAIATRTHEMVKKQYSTLNRMLLPTLENYNVRLRRIDDLSERELTYCRDVFRRMIYPVLTPLAIDQGRPFPLIFNQTLNLLVRVSVESIRTLFQQTSNDIRENGDALPNDDRIVIVRIPDVLPRLFRLPGSACDLVLLEDIVKLCLADLFSGADYSLCIVLDYAQSGFRY